MIGIWWFKDKKKREEKNQVNWDILLYVLLQFKSHKLKQPNLHTVLYLTFVGFSKIEEFFFHWKSRIHFSNIKFNSKVHIS